MPRVCASTSVCQALASPYREAVVTKSHRSAASRRRRESSRLLPSTESRSGASTRMRPGMAFSTTSRRPMSTIACPSSDSASSELTAMTGIRVVGRMTDAGEMSLPRRELKIVDLPAPDDPPNTTTVGRPSLRRWGRMRVASCVRRRRRDSLSCTEPGSLSGRRALSRAEIVRATRSARSRWICGVVTSPLSATIGRVARFPPEVRRRFAASPARARRSGMRIGSASGRFGVMRPHSSMDRATDF